MVWTRKWCINTVDMLTRDIWGTSKNRSRTRNWKFVRFTLIPLCCLMTSGFFSGRCLTVMKEEESDQTSVYRSEGETEFSPRNSQMSKVDSHREIYNLLKPVGEASRGLSRSEVKLREFLKDRLRYRWTDTDLKTPSWVNRTKQRL